MSCGCEDDPLITSQKGEKGDSGNNGWTALLSNVEDGERVVQKIIGWTGGTGTKPGFIGEYIGATEIVADIADATDIRGATGATGSTGAAGNDGWTAEIANVADGDRIVQQIVDWFGGEGTKPSTTNQFIGAAGIVSSAASAVDIRGATGATGADGSDAALPDQTSHSGEFLTTDGTTASWAEIIQVPALTSSTRRILRENHAGTDPEWYTTISEYKSIPFVTSGIFSSTTSYVTFRNSGSTVSLNVTLPNDSSIRRLFFKVSLNFSSTSPDGNSSNLYMALINTTAGTTLVENVAETAYRKFYAFEYMANITCSGQTIAVQWKHLAGQNASAFLGGFFSMIELV